MNFKSQKTTQCVITYSVSTKKVGNCWQQCYFCEQEIEEEDLRQQYWLTKLFEKLDLKVMVVYPRACY